MPRIDYFLSTISPFTYLAGDRLEKIAEKHGAEIFYKPFDVVANLARTGGVHPAERHPSRQEYRLQELRRIAAKNEMPINLKPAHWPTNAAPSSYAIIAAQKAGGGDIGRLSRNFLQACWANERDIAQDDVVRECLASAGFDAGIADSGLMVGAETYAANNEETVARGVFGAPFYIVDDERFWGQDRLSALDDYLGGATDA